MKFPCGLRNFSALIKDCYFYGLTDLRLLVVVGLERMAWQTVPG